MYLETQRLLVRELRPEDGPQYRAFQNSLFVLRYNAMQPMEERQVASYIQEKVRDEARLAIVDKSSGAFLGEIHIGADSLRWGVASAEVSYWLGEPYTGRGYMTEALEAVVAELLEAGGCESVTARVFSVNTPSVALLRRLGFRQEGHLHRAVRGYGGQIFDDLLFSRQKTLV